MKKTLLVGALTLFGMANAQESKSGEFRLGAHIGIPTGKLSNGYSFNIGADVSYVLPVAENLKVGVISGYSHYFGKEEEIRVLGYSLGKYNIPDAGIIPVAATGEYTFGDSKVFIGTDLGYAFFTGKNSSTGGFYFQPRVGYTFAEKHSVALSYKGISNNGTMGSFNLGYGFSF